MKEKIMANLYKALTENFYGPQCSKYDDNCPVCRAHRLANDVIEILEEEGREGED